MPAFKNPEVTLPALQPDDPRLGHLLGRACSRPEEVRVILLGFPSDEGVRINGGRPGAADAPDSIRSRLYLMTPDARNLPAFTDLIEHTVDLGNLELHGSVEENQYLLGQTLAPFLAEGIISIVLGGGHETSFGHFLGYDMSNLPVRILNWDAHPDVRPLINRKAHSGSPFRQALQRRACRGYTVAGLLPHSAAKEHLQFIEERGGRYIWGDELSKSTVDSLFSGIDERCMVTFDLDAVDQSWAPGVSAPASGGLSPDVWCHAAYQAGCCRHVSSIDVVELNPRYDVDVQTARLAALTVWNFLAGLAHRGR